LNEHKEHKENNEEDYIVKLRTLIYFADSGFY